MTRKFKKGDLVRVTNNGQGNEYEETVVRYAHEMTKYLSDEHLPGYYVLETCLVHESNLERV